MTRPEIQSKIDSACDPKITIRTIRDLQSRASTGSESLQIEQNFMIAAFEFVSNKTDWKGPICSLVVDEECPFAPEVVTASIRYMTATEADVIKTTRFGKPAHVFVADGYRMGPAGP